MRVSLVVRRPHAVAVKTDPKVFRRVRPLRHASCMVASSLRHVSCLRSGAGCSWGGRWASMLNSGGSFFARQSFASATPFVVLAAVVASSFAASCLASAGRSFLCSLRRGWACGATLAPAALKKEDAHPRLSLDGSLR